MRVAEDLLVEEVEGDAARELGLEGGEARARRGELGGQGGDVLGGFEPGG